MAYRSAMSYTAVTRTSKRWLSLLSASSETCLLPLSTASVSSSPSLSPLSPSSQSFYRSNRTTIHRTFSSSKNGNGHTTTSSSSQINKITHRADGKSVAPSEHGRATSSPSSSSSQIYTVAKVSNDGSISIENLSLSEILKGSSMHVRDLFSLALTSNEEHYKNRSSSEDGKKKPKKMRPPPAILPRRGEIIVSFGRVRALIGSESGMIFDAHERYVQHLANSLAQTFARKTSEAKTIHNATQTSDQQTTNTANTPQKIPYCGDPFELVFLEEVLREVSSSYNRRISIYEPIVEATLSKVTDEFLSVSSVHRLVPIKDSLQKFEMRVDSGLTCLTHLLQNDDDMLGLLLAENLKAEGRGEALEVRRHESVELLLEEYARQFENVRQEVGYLLRRVQSKQEMVAISLDAYRNKMIRVSLTVAITGLGFATSTSVAGFYGMNLTHGFEASPTAFGNVILATSTVGVFLIAGCMAYISEPNVKRRTLKKLEEIETIGDALTNMSALDYTMKQMKDVNVGPMDKKEFRRHITSCHQSANIKDKEVDFLFDVFDMTKDGFIHNDDFNSLQHLIPQNPPQSTP